jgi:hypothetical protein
VFDEVVNLLAPVVEAHQGVLDFVAYRAHFECAVAQQVGGVPLELVSFRVALRLRDPRRPLWCP